MQKIVFSDIDGTLSKGFVTVDFLEYLNKKGKLSSELLEKQTQLLLAHKRKEITYLELVPKWSQVVAECLAGKKVNEIKEEAREFFKDWKKQSIYKSTYKLIELLKEKGYLVVLISGGWEYPAQLIGEEIGANEVVGMKIGEKQGEFTNELINDVRTEEGKSKELKKFFTKYKTTKEYAMGFGDSIQDSAIFENVKKPVALNPSEELLRKATKNKWYIANKDNIIEVMQECFDKGKNP